MAETAYFYWPKISFEELDELVSSLKDQTEDKNLKVRETYLLRTKTRNITGSSVLELKKNTDSIPNFVIYFCLLLNRL